MKFLNIKTFAVLSLFATLLGCSKPEDKLVGTWQNVKTQSSIQFNKDKTGVIFQRTNPQLPPNITFKWAMVKDNDFMVEVPMQGTATQKANGALQDNETIVLEGDTFKRTK